LINDKYAAAGVNIEAADSVKKEIGRLARASFTPGVLAGPGLFGGLFELKGFKNPVLVSSMDGKKGLPPDAPYASAKFALAGFGEVLRQELRTDGISTTLVFPGRVDTAFIEGLKFHPISAPIPPQAVAEAILSGILRHKAEVVVPGAARLLQIVNTLHPALGDWAVRAFRLEGWKE